MRIIGEITKINKYRLFVFLFYPMLSFLISILYSSVGFALPIVGFDAGHIIDDGVFTNNYSMTPEQIQTFLNSKVLNCDTDGSQPASDFGRSDLTHAEYAASRGWSAPPYTCLKDYTENGYTSTQIIYNAAQQYQINPQVLIVLLQKEQGLVTDKWPLATQYRSATGYGCPDTAPCDSEYYGFTNQINHAAKMFRAIMNASPTWYTPYILGDNYIQYSPNGACGGSTVNIVNRSTQALYNYTPYQPNQAALDAGYGSGDSCSAHGNRNFYLYFSDWFGSTYAANLSAQPVWQQVYTDATKKNVLGWNASLVTGQSAYVEIILKNTGNITWTKSEAFGTTDTRLATYGPWGRQSIFCDNSWVINCTRPATLIEDSVAPGQYGTFEFAIKAPSQTGVYNESFAPIVDGRTVFTNGAMTIKLTVNPPTFSAQPVWQQIYTDASKTTALGWNATLVADQSAYVKVVMKNNGNMTWTKSGSFGNTDTRLATSFPWGRKSIFCDNSWVINCTRPATLIEDSVAPGQYGTFEFAIKAPSQIGSYIESFTPIIDGRTVFNSGGMGIKIDVVAPKFSAQAVWQQVYTDASKTTTLGWNATLATNQSAYVKVVMKNNGNMTWTKSGSFGTTDTRLATSFPWGRQSTFCDNSWVINCTRPASLIEDSVAPGAYGTFEFAIKAPSQPGTYIESFTPIIDGRTVFSSGGMGIGLTVK